MNSSELGVKTHVYTYFFPHFLLIFDFAFFVYSNQSGGLSSKHWLTYISYISYSISSKKKIPKLDTAYTENGRLHQNNTEYRFLH